jgi:hypothetical protein
MDIPAWQITASISIDKLVEESYGTAKAKGWHDPGMEKTIGDDIALIHSELSEALEDFRNGRKPNEVYYEATVVLPGGEEQKMTIPSGELLGKAYKGTPKPCGFPVELADAIIRIADVCGKHNIDLDTALKMKLGYNKTRPHRHGNKVL